MTQPKQKGFTLVEIAVVLVIIGLLLGAILQGQQLIASARVQNLADQQSGIQAAYFGFLDRYGQIPGDMPQEEADQAIRGEVLTGGNGNGILEAPGEWEELYAVWEHLAKAGFISGGYEGWQGEHSREDAPTNAFNGIVLLSRHDGYTTPQGQTASPRLTYYFGNNVSADIARELDVKLDDGRPNSGSLRHTAEQAGDPEPHEARSDNCVLEDENAWNIDPNPDSCNPVFLF